MHQNNPDNKNPQPSQNIISTVEDFSHIYFHSDVILASSLPKEASPDPLGDN